MTLSVLQGHSAIASLFLTSAIFRICGASCGPAASAEFLVLLDLSSAFDTVDNDCLLSLLHRRFAIDGSELDWFRCYLSERMQTFTTAGGRINRPCCCCLWVVSHKARYWSCQIHSLHGWRCRHARLSPCCLSSVCAVLGQILKNWYLNRIPNTC